MGPHIINLGSTLPDITGPVHIDGYSQPGAVMNSSEIGNNGTVCIVLNGFSGTGSLAAMVVPQGVAEGTSVRVDGLAFSGFDLAAITFSGGSDHAVSGSRFGGSLGATVLDPSGYGVQVGRDMTGVHIGGPLLSDRNVFADATIAAISIAGSGSVQPSEVLVENNYIGTTPGGGGAEPNQRGIIVRGFNNRIRNNRSPTICRTPSSWMTVWRRAILSNTTPSACRHSACSGPANRTVMACMAC
ncbi:MAG: hypothetical protein IPO08_16865 [Xanthomonadales bacterium]|nr:hypothetical protein [Xanthomonadales bacterium]